MAKEVNINLLVQLADAGIAQTVSDYGALPVDIREALQAELAQRKADLNKSAALEIVALLEKKDAFLLTQAQLKADYEAKAAACGALMAETQRATSFGMNRNNFIPLAKQIGEFVPANTKAELTKIPKDWTAPVEAPAAAAAQTTAAPAAAAA